MVDTLLSRLKRYCSDNFLAMHMPGAKRKPFIDMLNPYILDITEIEGFDNLHDMKDILKDEKERAEKLFNCDSAYFLINGSSAGILSAVCGTVERGDDILIARNCHISVFNAVELSGANSVFIEPDKIFNTEDSYIYGKINPKEIEKILSDNQKIKAVVITSPTYEGIMSDVNELSRICHNYGVVLIVDQAHGAHLGFDSSLPDTANNMNADVVVISLHKTLPALTQTGLLCINGNLVDKKKIEHFWNIFQTTSPSYVLMASISACMDYIQSEGDYVFKTYVNNLLFLRNEIKKLKNIRLLQTDDIGKIVLLCCNGKYLYNKLISDYKIQLEMYAKDYVIAMTSILDTKEDYNRFLSALTELDKLINDEDVVVEIKSKRIETENNRKENIDNGIIEVAIEQSSGYISVNNIMVYPPGIPRIISGDVITDEDVEYLGNAINSGLKIIGLTENMHILCKS